LKPQAILTFPPQNSKYLKTTLIQPKSEVNRRSVLLDQTKLTSLAEVGGERWVFTMASFTLQWDILFTTKDYIDYARQVKIHKELEAGRQ